MNLLLHPVDSVGNICIKIDYGYDNNIAIDYEGNFHSDNRVLSVIIMSINYQDYVHDDAMLTMIR